MPDDFEVVREKLIGAIEAGRVEFEPGVKEAMAAINWQEPDFQITNTALMVCWDANPFNQGGFEVRWTTKSAGVGSATVYLKDGQLHCDNEGMGPAFLKEVFSDLVDRMVLADAPPKDLE